jgi:hypothetical protein
MFPGKRKPACESTPALSCAALSQEAVLDGGGPGTEGGQRWRRLLWRYLAAVFEVDPGASAEFHELQVRGWVGLGRLKFPL